MPMTLRALRDIQNISGHGDAGEGDEFDVADNEYGRNLIAQGDAEMLNERDPGDEQAAPAKKKKSYRKHQPTEG